MSLSAAVLSMLAGLVGLAGGGELLVRAATSLAQVAGLTPAVIGLTVVAAGTSLPELTVSVLAALRGSPDIALANVIGSNICNIGLILALTALVSPLTVRGNVVKIEWPIMFLVSGAMVALAWDQRLSRVDGAVFLVSLVAFVLFSLRIAAGEVTPVLEAEYATEVERRDLPNRLETLGATLLLLGLGIAILVIGGRLLVEGAVAVARSAGLSERVIGLTIVAAGTSAPELAASIVAARRGQADVAIGNVIGSNVFNILGILGITALVTPIQVDAAVLRTDVWWMLGLSLALFPFMRSGLRVTRREGAALLAGYTLYVALLLR